jgi:hypothetical protein
VFGERSNDNQETSIQLPGMEFTHPIQTLDAITEEDYRGLSDGRAQIYIWGEITYLDIFEKKHTTTFRMQSRALKGGQVNDLEASSEGNDAT